MTDFVVNLGLALGQKTGERCMKKMLPAVMLLWGIWLRAGSYPETGSLVLQAGGYAVQISASAAYTISGFRYDGVELMPRPGANGTQLVLPSGAMAGSSSGKGDSAEQIVRLQLRVDGQERDVKTPLEVLGDEIVLLKEAHLGGLVLLTETTVSSVGVTQSIRYRCETLQPLSYFYLFAMGWDAALQEYMALTPGGDVSGSFVHAGGWVINREVNWLALYDPVRSVGVVTTVRSFIPTAVRRHTVWDHRQYKKYYLFHPLPTVSCADYSPAYTLFFCGFRSPPKDWRKQAAAVVPVIQSAVAAVPAPVERRLNPLVIPDYGDRSGEDWRTNRRGIEALTDDYVLPPFTPVVAEASSVSVWNRRYHLASSGLLSRAEIAGADYFARPMSLVVRVDGQPVTFRPGQARIISQGRGRVVYEHTLISPRLEILNRTTVEFDGMVRLDMTLQPRAPLMLDHLSYAFHLPASESRFLHFIGCPAQNNVSIMIPKESYSLSVPAQDGVFLREPFKTLVWFGDHDRGFLWFCGSERHWSPAVPSERPDALIAERRDGEVEFRVSPVQQSFRLSEPTTYTFGFFATPVRPFPAGWRGWFLTTRLAQYGSEQAHGYIGTLPMIWPDEFRNPGFPRLSLENTAKVKRLIREMKAAGQPVLTYIDPIRTDMAYLKYLDQAPASVQLNDLFLDETTHAEDAFLYKVPELAENLRQWQTLPPLIYSYGAARGGREVRVSSASGWADYFCFLLEKMAELGFDGFGDIDNCFPIRDMNGEHDAGFIGLDGERYPEWDWFARRDLMKRICAVFLKVRGGKPGIMIAHASATWSIPCISFCDAAMVFEHSNSGYYSSRSFLSRYCPDNDRITEDLQQGGRRFLRWVFPKERWQAELTGRQFGLPAVIMSNLSKSPQVDQEYAHSVSAARELGAFALAHDTIFWPIWCNTAALVSAIKVRQDFGISAADVVCYPYWQKNHPVEATAGLSVTAYQHGVEWLLAVCNLEEEERHGTLNLGKLRPQMVTDAESCDSLKLADGRLDMRIAGRDYRLLRVQGE